jgi:tetratricopeptide (TPR) repeat protein
MAVSRLACSALALLLSIPRSASQTAIPGKSSLEQEIETAEAAIHAGRFAEARQHFEQAERLGGHSAEINAGIGISELQLGHYEASRQREAKVLELVAKDHERAEAHNLIGTAWLRESGQGATNLVMLRAAEESFQRAVQLDPVFDAAHFNLGNALLRQGREEEASAAFKNFLEAAANNPAYELDVPLAPKALAPAFVTTDSSGHAVSSEALRGRFVLLDLWATWCGPCMRALPAMRQLAHYFPATELTMVSVNEDAPDQDVWRKFIAQQKMDWVQVWDKNAQIYQSFHLAPPADLSLPRYVLLDRNGAVLRVYDGLDRLGLMVGQIVRTVTAAPRTP